MLGASRQFGHNWLNGFSGHQREKACVSVQPAVAQGSFRVHWIIKRCAVLSTAIFFSASASQEAKQLCTASTKRHPLRHHFGPRCNEWPQRLDSVCSHQGRPLQKASTRVLRCRSERLRASGSEPSHKNRLDSVRQGPGAIVTNLVLSRGSAR